MIQLTGAFLTIFCLLSTILLSRPFLTFLIKWSSKKKLVKLNKQVKDIYYSYEELTYFVSLPNRNPDIFQAPLSRFKADPVFRSFIFPEIEGLRIYLKTAEGETHIAYMSSDKLRVPALDRLKHENLINEKEYHNMKLYILIHPVTKKAFIDEVYRQIRRDDRILIIDEPV